MAPTLFDLLWNDWIREVRRAKMNIKGAAKYMGFSEFTMDEVELGRRLFSADELTRFLKMVAETVPEGLTIPVETDPKKLLRRQKTMIGLQRRHRALGNAVGGDATEVEVQTKIEGVRVATQSQAAAKTLEAATKIRRYLEVKKVLAGVEQLRTELTTLSKELCELQLQFPGCLPTEIAEDLSNDFFLLRLAKSTEQAKNGKTVSLEEAYSRLNA